MFRPSRIALVVLLNVCSVAAAGAAVGLYRYSNSVLYRERTTYPRPLPWPDKLLLRLDDWYDVRFPCPPGYFKLHAEHGRVVTTLWVWFGVFALASLLWLWLLVLPWLLRRLGYAGPAQTARRQDGSSPISHTPPAEPRPVRLRSSR